MDWFMHSQISINGMTIEEFTDSATNEPAPPSEVPEKLKALWWARRGDWERAHRIAQDIASKDGSWVHAYLHRVKGDDSNAGYWYSRAGKPHPEESLDTEWEQIVSMFLLR